MKQNEKNPAEYGYVGNEEITMDASKFMRIGSAIDFALSKETKEYFPEKYKYVNRDTGATIKTVTEKNKHLAVKILDVDSTLASTPTIFRTREGIEILKVKILSEGIHIDMIDKGVAKHKSFFESMVKGVSEVDENPNVDTQEEELIEGVNAEEDTTEKAEGKVIQMDTTEE